MCNDIFDIFIMEPPTFWSFVPSLLIFYVMPSFLAVISSMFLIIICVRSLKSKPINIKLLIINGLINIMAMTLFRTVSGDHDDLYTRLTILDLCIIFFKYLVSLLILEGVLKERGIRLRMRTKHIVAIGMIVFVVIVFFGISFIDHSFEDIIKYDFVYTFKRSSFI